MKVWDLSTATCAFSHNLSETIVDTIKWDLVSDSVLITASDDGHIRVSDIRSSKEVSSFKFDHKIENFSADPMNPTQIHASFENGHIGAIDLKAGAKPLYDVAVSSKAVTSISLSSTLAGMICTSGLDGAMNVYNFKQGGKPTFVCREFANQGHLFGGAFSPDNELLYCCGSSKGEVVVWTMEDNKSIKDAFGIAK